MFDLRPSVIDFGPFKKRVLVWFGPTTNAIFCATFLALVPAYQQEIERERDIKIANLIADFANEIAHQNPYRFDLGKISGDYPSTIFNCLTHNPAAIKRKETITVRRDAPVCLDKVARMLAPARAPVAHFDNRWFFYPFAGFVLGMGVSCLLRPEEALLRKSKPGPPPRPD